MDTVTMVIQADKDWLLAELASLRLVGPPAVDQAVNSMVLNDAWRTNFATLSIIITGHHWTRSGPLPADLVGVWHHFMERFGGLPAQISMAYLCTRNIPPEVCHQAIGPDGRSLIGVQIKTERCFHTVPALDLRASRRPPA